MGISFSTILLASCPLGAYSSLTFKKIAIAFLQLFAVSLQFTEVFKADKKIKAARLKLPKKEHRNNHPIIVVHGLAGRSMNDNTLLGDYFYFVNDSEVPLSLASSSLSQVYEADVSALGSVHDRACELY